MTSTESVEPLGLAPPPEVAGSRPTPRVVVVGPCASGKTTLVEHLRARGFDAAVCGQEHSEIATLWRHTAPDLVIALHVDLETIRERRGADWPRALYDTQLRRLADALDHAAAVLDAAALDAGEVAQRAEAVLRRHSR